MEEVSTKEINAIHQMYSHSGRDRPLITVFAAIRNHPMRFWDVDGGSQANLPPGCWVSESGIHQCQFPNFYLLGHAGIKGMSRPVRYFILQDDIGMAYLKARLNSTLLKFWASFLYEQCYMYQRSEIFYLLSFCYICQTFRIWFLFLFSFYYIGVRELFVFPPQFIMLTNSPNEDELLLQKRWRTIWSDQHHTYYNYNIIFYETFQ